MFGVEQLLKRVESSQNRVNRLLSFFLVAFECRRIIWINIPQANLGAGLHHVSLHMNGLGHASNEGSARHIFLR